jgi:alkylation response protein AidB-like acyl-CoA dehydrogenase
VVLAQEALEAMLNFARQRKQFGKNISISADPGHHS